MRLPRLFRWLIWLVAGIIGLVMSLLVFLPFVKGLTLTLLEDEKEAVNWSPRGAEKPKRDTSKREKTEKEQIDLVVAPTSKKPEFFSLATPLAVKGTFSDFKMGIQTGGLIGTAIRFITSPLAVPLARLIDKGLPEDGSDVCGMRLGPDNRPEKPLPGCIVWRAR